VGWQGLQRNFNITSAPKSLYHREADGDEGVDGTVNDALNDQIDE
jgi:hypothetical protein